MKTVFHLSSNDSDKLAEVLGNVKNLLEDGEVETEEVAVVANAEGVEALTQDSKARKYVEDLTAKVNFKACSNSLGAQEIKENELIEGVEPVSSAVGELTRLQHDNYSYIRP